MWKQRWEPCWKRGSGCFVGEPCGGVCMRPPVALLSSYGLISGGHWLTLMSWGSDFLSRIHKFTHPLVTATRNYRFSSGWIPDNRALSLFSQNIICRFKLVSIHPTCLSYTHPSALRIFSSDPPHHKLYNSWKLMKRREADLRKVSTKPDFVFHRYREVECWKEHLPNDLHLKTYLRS